MYLKGMEPEILKLWHEFQKALDEYENDPYRKKDVFWSREEHEDFEAFIKWLEYKYIE